MRKSPYLRTCEKLKSLFLADEVFRTSAQPRGSTAPLHGMFAFNFIKLLTSLTNTHVLLQENK